MSDDREAESFLPISAPKVDAQEYTTYDFVVDKVGFLPNFRKSDNILQLKVFAATWCACIVFGLLWSGADGAFLGALLGIVVALVVSGAGLALVGLRRKS